MLFNKVIGPHGQANIENHFESSAKEGAGPRTPMLVSSLVCRSFS
jgi:hypothetical protein